MTLAQKLEHEFDERLSKIGSTEELDDVLVRQAHNEALIEFEYQRREEAEADSRRQDKLLEQELYRAYRRNCLKTVVDRQELKSRQDHLHAMRQMLQTRQQSELPTLISGTRKNLVKQIGFERRQLPNLYNQRKTSSITPYYTPKNPFRRQTEEIDRVLKSMHKAEYDNDDQSIDPTKTVAAEDTLDAVVAEVERHSHKLDPNSALSPVS